MKFCQRCGCQLSDDASFCSMCGTAQQVNSQQTEQQPMYQQETPQQNYNQFYQAPQSMYQQGMPQQTYNQFYQPVQNNSQGSMPSFIIGLVGSLLSIFGSMCTAMCLCTSKGSMAFFLLFTGSIIGLIGSCISLKNGKKGAKLQLIAAAIIIIHIFFGFNFMALFGFICLLAAGIVGYAYSSNKK